MSKGDSPRPHDPARYRSEWERIFPGSTPMPMIRKDAPTEAPDPARGETGEET